MLLKSLSDLTYLICENENSQHIKYYNINRTYFTKIKSFISFTCI